MQLRGPLGSQLQAAATNKTPVASQRSYERRPSSMANTLFSLLLAKIALASARCFEPSPAFPVPQWDKVRCSFCGTLLVTSVDDYYTQSGPWIPASAFSAISDELDKIDKDLLVRSSYSIEVTSGDATLWTKYHSAQEHDKHRPGVTHVDGDSQYRIASITKVFTTLGLLYQHESGNLNLNDAVDKYIPELKEPDKGELPWKDIALRTLASQL